MSTAQPSLGKKQETEKKDLLEKNRAKGEDEEPPSTIEKKLREKPALPSVRYLLEHGDPTSAPESASDSLAFLGGLFLTFLFSFVVWHFLFLRGDSMVGQKKNWGSEI
mmetsp:Transcript_6278/g.9253  ORF Transcript_6278/g.9253 Transcript_6278/m.9253 type:complete len:108 (-) Transcript_6278:734-1057(-)